MLFLATALTLTAATALAGAMGATRVLGRTSLAATSTPVPTEVAFALEEGSRDNTVFLMAAGAAMKTIHDLGNQPRWTSNSRVSVVTFKSDARIAVPLTSDLLSTETAIQKLNAREGGGTCIGCAIRIAQIQFNAAGTAGAHRFIVVLTAGNEGEFNTYAGVAADVKKAGVTVLAVGLGLKPNMDTINNLASDVPGVQTAFRLGGDIAASIGALIPSQPSPGPSESASPSPSTSPSPSASPSASTSPSVSTSPSESASPSETPTASPTETTTPSATPTPSPTETTTPSETPTASPTETTRPTASATASASPTATPTASASSPAGSVPSPTETTTSAGVTVVDSNGQPLAATPVLSTGARVGISASGFRAGETVSATVFSTPRSLPATTAGADGSVSYAFTVPANLEPGVHKLVLSGASAHKVVVFTVTAATGSTSPAASDGGMLAKTGVGIGELVLLALGLLLVGAVAVRYGHHLRDRSSA
ncbi:VWA domain-containing protein [Planosporangium thailandense]|uniref:VWA domain-containing protein n=1 Tax=Planosporangium thailandense TaxID=765197 RepID=A0ABX0XXG7_9ACTN|nr:vWA domain-containing protein [Planosporangium thailandense]NJC70742.1 VWA domain-containing protein [Planosporangium thailandense]